MIEVTEVHYMYRDAANYKSYGHVKLAGVITAEQRAAVKATLQAGEYFIPTQIGWGHLGENSTSGWSSFPCEDDHAWHELNVDEIEVSPVVHKPDVVEGTVDDWVKKMTEIGPTGWDEVKHDPNNEED